MCLQMIQYNACISFLADNEMPPLVVTKSPRSVIEQQLS